MQLRVFDRTDFMPNTYYGHGLIIQILFSFWMHFQIRRVTVTYLSHLCLYFFIKTFETFCRVRLLIIFFKILDIKIRNSI